MRNYVFKKLVSTILLIICIEILFCSVGILPVASSINNTTIENNLDDEIISNQYFGRWVYRFFLFGPIYNLTIDGDDYDFESNNLWGLKIERRWGTSGWEFDREIFHRKNVHGSMGFGGFKFRGIIRPNFICGCFCESYFNWWISNN